MFIFSNVFVFNDYLLLFKFIKLKTRRLLFLKCQKTIKGAFIMFYRKGLRNISLGLIHILIEEENGVRILALLFL